MYRIFIACFALVGLNTYTLTNSLKLDQPNFKEFSKTDFFKETKYLEPAMRNLTFSGKKEIKNIPVFDYRYRPVGLCTIVCYPKDLADWQSKMGNLRNKMIVEGSVNHMEIMHSFINRIISDPLVQNKFEIYAFYTAARDVIEESDLEAKVLNPNFPRVIYVYKKVGSKWLFLKKPVVQNWKQFTELHYMTVTANN